MRKFLIIFLFVTAANWAQFSYWEFYNSMPKPVAGGDIWQNFDNVFIIGGYSDSTQRNTNWVQRYNLSSNLWNLDTMITERFGLVVENYNNQIYFFGGVNSDDTSITGITNWGADINSEMALNYNNNFNRIFSTGHIIGDNFYIIGGNPLPGTRSDTLAYIVEYNLNESVISFKNDTLFTNEDFPEQQMSEVVGDDIFIFGGVINGISQDIYKYNIIDHSYKKLDIKLLEPRAGGRAVLGMDPNQIIIIGGYNESSPALNSVEVFSVFDDQYFIESAMPIQQARYNFMTATLYGYIYIFGGFDENRKVINSIERMNFEAVVNIEEDIKNIPSNFELQQNYPNPFNPTTTIEYSIPIVETGYIPSLQIIVYDVLGREIKTLVNRVQTPGNYKIEFDGSNFPSGVYYYQLKSGTFIQTKKMLLLK
ncbi:MAG: T9SS type A sorting domain-containing protein [Ignavibacteriae bacterium]|nr:T9SS type A sorting domain-containing protein [Ignavibacteriota bacterium]